jgi:RNA polymerase sigma factor (sigma-70 family)
MKVAQASGTGAMGDNPLRQVVRHIRRAAGTPSAAASEDRQLLEQFLSRHDEDAFALLVRRHGPMVLGVCRRLLRDPNDADDAFQVVFLVLIRKAHALSNRDLLANWLYGVAYRTALKARAQRARRGARERQVAQVTGTEPPGEAVAEGDLRGVLDEEVCRLPQKYRLPVVLCYLQGATLTEAARELGWPAGTVSGRLARARALLRARLTRRGVVPTAMAAAVLSREAPAAVPASLAQATIRGALALAAGPGRAGGELSAPVVALMKGVLNAMLLSKVKLAVLIVLTVGAVGAGTWALAQPNRAAPPPTPPAAEREAAPPPDRPAAADDLPKIAALDEARVKDLIDAAKVSDKLKELLKDQHEAALTEARARWEELLAGRGTLDIFIGASRRLLEAERDLSDKKADQVAALENHWRRMKVLVEVNQERFDAGRVPIADLSQTKFYRIQAEIALERAKAK